ncbi:MAG: M23 family metallopeptidase [Caulobacteraceae bacterium]|nr:MAG: M23 family metallopeptidase [Caulobacteraceae bacterium]
MAFNGRFEQGATVIGRTTPGAYVAVDGQYVGKASGQGLFVVGFDRDAAPQAAIAVSDRDRIVQRQAQITDGRWDVQRIDGLPQDQVNPEGEALLARIAAENIRKAAGFASNIDADYFRDGFDMPLAATRISGRFGGQRILNGQPMRPHYGTDLAAPLGTPIVAPCAGVVSFAETGLHYEGGLTMIDHGQGLVTAYLHQSSVEVSRGDVVRRGQRIGAVGKEGRATGPHLCWRMKWRGRYLDPAALLGIEAPLRV